ncbi:Dehydrogenase/reductase SDR family member 7 [Linum perenne]
MLGETQLTRNAYSCCAALPLFPRPLRFSALQNHNCSRYCFALLCLSTSTNNHLLVFFLNLKLAHLFSCSVQADATLSSKRGVNRQAIEDKVVWITGASRGIGEVLAKQFASLGAKLILSARNEAELERVKSQLIGKHAPHDVKILPLDLASGEDSLKEAVDKAEGFFPGAGVHYMIHNAAYERPKSTALETNEESTQMSSAAGKTPAPGQAVYSASKFALNGYFHSLRSELYQKGIKVTVVCPGPIATGFGSSNSEKKRRLSSDRCAELTIIAASHGLKEVWISNQPVLAVMYLVQYMPSIGWWLMDKIGERRVQAAEQKGDTYSLGLLFGKKKTT